jgi:hypothetical protein
MTKYDLRGIQEVPLSPVGERATQFISLGAGVVFLASAAYFLIRGILSNGPPVAFVAAALFALLGSLFEIGAWMRRPPSAFVEVDDSGIGLISVAGRTHHLLWADPRFRLSIAATNGAPDRRSNGRPMYGIRGGRRGLQTMLSRDAFEAMVIGARSHGLAVRVTPEPSSPGWSRYTISH